MKAIIPVAGAGVKLRPITYTQPKPLIPVAGKPIIAFILDQLIDAGIDDFIFIIGYLGDKIEDYVNQNYPQIKKTYISQGERKGLGHAIWSAKLELANESEVVIILGDTIAEVDLKVFLRSKHSCLAIKKVKDPRTFGVVELDAVGRVIKVVEKPKIPTSNNAIVGLYYIKDLQKLLHILEANISQKKKTKGEFHLTDALMTLIDNGVEFDTMEIQNWFDCGKKDSLLETNAFMLNKLHKFGIPQYPNTIVIPPVSIGQDCKIENSIIGPHVTIADNVNLDSVILKDSIIGNFSSLEHIVLKHSIIGNDAFIRGTSQSLNVGDNTEIDFQ